MNDDDYDDLPADREKSGSASRKVKGILSGTREDLRSVAQYQKAILVCILINILVFASQFFLPPTAKPLLAAALILVGLVSTVCVFLLALKIYSTAVGIILGVLALIPCIGLLVLVIINGKATNILKENGIHVGLLGADPSRI